jgi:hypothetical protein
MICTGKIITKYKNNLVLFMVDEPYYNDFISFKQQYERDYTVYTPTIVARLNTNDIYHQVMITKSKNSITRIVELNNIKQKRLCSPQYEINSV